MKRIGMTALVLVGVFVVSATGASAASPSYGRCLKYNNPEVNVPAGTLTYSNAGCTLMVVGSTTEKDYEWYPGFAPPHPIKLRKFMGPIVPSTLAFLESVPSQAKVTCKGATLSGEYTGEKQVGDVIITLTACEAFGAECKNAGAGEIVTNTLEGELGVELKGNPSPLKDKIGLNLFSPSGTIMTFTCVNVPSPGVVVRGSVIHRVASNAMKLTPTEKFAEKTGEQKPDKFVGGIADEHTLLSEWGGGPLEETGLSLAVVVTNEEKIEVSSIN